MKRKMQFYLALIGIGLSLALLALVLQHFHAPDSLGGMLMGSGSGLAAMGLAQLLSLRQEQKDPALRKQNEIARTDDRNVAIRNRAKALSGDMLQWFLMAVAWVSIGFGSPLWMPLAAITVFVLKSVLDVCLIVRYQREM